MLKNYLKLAYRNIKRQKLYSFINISGLSIGIACFLLISLWVFDELSYDQFHINKERIFRVNTMTSEYGLVTSSSWRLGPALKEKYPEIEAYTRIWPFSRSLVKYKDKIFDESSFWLADPALFRMTSFQFIQGSRESALKDKYTVVITEETAQRYFGNENPMGKSLFVREYEHDFEVCGVIKNIPLNSSIRFDLIGRVDLMPRQRLESWEFTGYTLVLLNGHVSPDDFGEKISTFYKKFVNPETDAYPLLQLLTNIHLYEYGRPGLIKQVYLFSVIAIFILLIACINFMNLSTARATRRAVEVGVRKVFGAYRKQIIIQFLSESILISVLSLIIGVFILEVLVVYINQITDKQLSLFSGNMTHKVMFLVISVIVTGILSGSYPALYLSSFHPVKTLKGKSLPANGGKSFRRVLTIFQFAVSIGLIICVFTVQKQLRYIETKDIGFKKELILNVINNPDLNSRFDTFRNELLQNPDIESVTSSASIPFNIGTSININWEGHFDQDPVSMPYNMVEYDFFKTFGMKFIEGRSFSNLISTDEQEACIINESAARLMGYESAVGKQVYFDHPAFEESFKKVRIIGVVNDFHAHSLYKEIVPSIFRMYKPWQFYIYIKIAPGDAREILKFVEEITRVFAPEYPFRYEFVDQTYWQMYQAELNTRKILNSFAIIAILISCLGLFGLASYTVERRTVEIGIRKVVGSSILEIAVMLSKEFLKWVIFANLIAWPVAWYVMNKWLDNFVYRIDLNWWIFIASGLLGLIVALVTVIFQSVKAAMMNPAETLRYE